MHKPTDNAPLETDALIVGAGPVGLFQIFQLGLQGVHCHAIDNLAHAGGQCAELYPDKPLYDIPGVPVCTGRELIAQLQQQIRPFNASFHFNQLVSQLTQQADGRFLVQTNHQRFLSKTIFIAAGVGAFSPRPLNATGADQLGSPPLHYQPPAPATLAQQHLVIAGDGDSALQAAIQFSTPGPHAAASVTVVHRRDSFSAEPATVAQFNALRGTGQLHFIAGQITEVQHSAQRLQHIQILLPDASQRSLPVDQLLVLQGLSPKLGPIGQWGLAMERRQLQVDPASCATNIPGIFAIGDINHYPGKKKLILCGFHECVLAAFAAMPLIQGGPPPLLQYTTTSTKLHKLLGVAPSAT